MHIALKLNRLSSMARYIIEPLQAKANSDFLTTKRSDVFGKNSVTDANRIFFGNYDVLIGYEDRCLSE